MLGDFNLKLKEYEGKKIMQAYEELQELSDTGEMPAESFFRELVKERQRIYNTDYNINATKADVMEEIARRWYEMQNAVQVHDL